jgi:hypothetical protein
MPPPPASPNGPPPLPPSASILPAPRAAHRAKGRAGGAGAEGRGRPQAPHRPASRCTSSSRTRSRCAKFSFLYFKTRVGALIIIGYRSRLPPATTPVFSRTSERAHVQPDGTVPRRPPQGPHTLHAAARDHEALPVQFSFRRVHPMAAAASSEQGAGSCRRRPAAVPCPLHGAVHEIFYGC